MRRLLAALLAISASLPTAPVTAQAEAGVRLQLLEQSLWNGPFPDRRVLEVRLRAVNGTAEALDGLSLFLTVHSPARGRLEYEASLSGDPTVQLFGEPRELAGSIPPGGTRDLLFRHRIDELHERGVTGVYPMKLELRADDVPLATIRSPIVYVVPEEDDVPLAVAATFVLAERIRQHPSGAFSDRVLEAAVADGGSLRALVGALESTPALAATVAVSPILLQQLADMRDGYRVAAGPAVPASGQGARDAAEVLEAIGRVVRSREVDLAAYPYAGPSLPALAQGGLDRDIAVHLDHGRRLVQSLLGTAPDPRLIRPPFGLIDTASIEELDRLARPEGPALLLDAGSATPPVDEPDLGFSPVATGRLEVAGERGPEAILPSASVAAILEDVGDDPALRAHAALGELATIYLEEPGEHRAVAMLFGEATRPDGAFVRPFLAGMHSIPILRPLGANGLLRELPGEAGLPIVTRSPATFSLGYETAIRDARSAIGRFSATFRTQGRRAAELGTRVLLAESQQFIRDETAGRALLAGVERAVAERIAQIQPPPRGRVFTLASRNGAVPVTIRNGSGAEAWVQVRLLSSALRFPGGGSQLVRLEGNVTTSTFAVQARRGGRFPIDVVVCTPAPHTPPAECTPESPAALASSQIVVRSTVYNRVALVLTAGAALFLLAGWGRRVLRRARS